jgi:serine/threonine-protein kinase RsbT
VHEDRPNALRDEPPGHREGRGEVLYRESFRIVGNDFEHGGEAATAVKGILKQLGFPPEAIRRLSIANFEAEMNVIMYANEAEMALEVLPDAVRVTIADHGPGIPDIEWAMKEGNSTATPAMRARGFGAGLGLPNIRRNSDEFSISSTVNVGTTLSYVVYANGSTGGSAR